MLAAGIRAFILTGRAGSGAVCKRFAKKLEGILTDEGPREDQKQNCRCDK
jgi:hypothetical protein